jgi:hypothetical protein
MWESTGISELTNADERNPGRTGPILDLRFRLRSSPWRMGPAWALLAGALAVDAPFSGIANLLRLAGALILADAVWGVLWLRTPSGGAAPDGGTPHSRIPYAGAHSPMSKVIARLSSEGDAGWQGVVLGLLVAAVLSSLVGRGAFLLSLLALLAAMGARLAFGQKRAPAFLLALLGAGLPWALGASLGWSPQGSSFLDASGAGLTRVSAALTLGGSFTFLHWMVLRIPGAGRFRAGRGVLLGQLAVLLTLVTLREPVAVALVACLMVAPGLYTMKDPASYLNAADTRPQSDPWWLASMLTAALVVR